MKTRQALAGLILGCAALAASAQSPAVLWAVSAYGTGGIETTMGCGGCASDQRAMAVDAAGNVFVTGFAVTAIANDILTTKFDAATGAVAWQKSFDSGFNAFQQAWGLALDAAGNAIVTGYVYTGVEYDIVTIKYAAADGAVLWQKTFTGPANGIDFGITIATDAAGNVFVGGNVWNGANDDFKVIKYAASDGALLWDKTFAGAAGFNDYAFAMAVDAGGNAIVAGEHQLSATDSDWLVIKYAAADGAVLWQRDFAGTGGALDIPYSLVLDAAGNAIVAGNTHNGTNFDARIAKYAAADGATLWEKTFAGDDGGDDMYYSVVLDAAGNAFAAGFSFSASGGNDWTVARHAAADGNTTWRRFVNGAGSLSDVAVSIALDALGNPVAGGRINDTNDASNRDMHAAAFSATDGTPRWSYTHAGGAGGFDRIVSVARSGPAMVLAGESTESGAAPAWRVVKVLDPVTDADGDGIPNAVEQAEGVNPLAKDNDVFANARLFAMQQYRDFLAREGDPAGIDTWTNQVSGGAMTRAQVVEAFFDSAEFQTGLPQITRLYFAFFNRIPDSPGLLFHAGRYRAGVPLNTIAQDFAGSQEFLLTYGSLSNGQYVDLVYQNVLGRPADPAGRANALAQLDGGAMTRGELMVAFSESQEHLNLSASEVFVTAVYVGMLRRSPDPNGLQNWVNAFSTGMPRVQMLQAFLGSQEYHNRFLP